MEDWTKDERRTIKKVISTLSKNKLYEEDITDAVEMLEDILSERRWARLVYEEVRYRSSNRFTLF